VAATGSGTVVPTTLSPAQGGSAKGLAILVAGLFVVALAAPAALSRVLRKGGR
jgi:hypothetical protein